MKRTQSLIVSLCLLAAACGGGGGGGTTLVFSISGSVPADGDTAAPVDAAIVISFNPPADVATIGASEIRLERLDGSPVAAQLLTQSFSGATVRLQPVAALDENAQYRVRVSGAIQSSGGATLGSDRLICFITANPTPTVRPDQLVDLGDGLNVARYLARHVRTPDGRVFVFGGFSDQAGATDTIEEWIPATRTFRLLTTRMSVPRAEHSATLLSNGTVLIAGGVSSPGAEPLSSTEFFSPSTGAVNPGPDMQHARRWHGASPFFHGDSAAVTGGFGAGGVMLDSAEFLDGNQWSLLNGALAEPTAQHLQFGFDFDKIYIGSSNLSQLGTYYNGLMMTARREGDTRFRAAAQLVSSGRYFVVGGDTRSASVYSFAGNTAKLSTDLLFERRGAHSLTPRGPSGHRFLVAGGFNVAVQGVPALQTLEIADYLEIGPFGFPDSVFYRVLNVQLPVPFAGHVGFAQADGATVLAGGWGGDTGPHSRRVVIVLDETSTPPPTCD